MAVVGSDEELPVYEIGSVGEEDRSAIVPTVLFSKGKTAHKGVRNRRKYSDMVETALHELNETRTGSSRQAIIKYIKANFEVAEKPDRYVCLALVKLLERERVVRKTGVGSSGKFSLAKEVREEIKRGKKKKAKPKGNVAARKTAKGDSSSKPEKTKVSKSKSNRKSKENEDDDSNKENKVKTTTNAKRNGGKTTSGEQKKKKKASADGKATTNRENKKNGGTKPGHPKSGKETKRVVSKAKRNDASKNEEGLPKSSTRHKVSEEKNRATKTTKASQAKTTKSKKDQEKSTANKKSTKQRTKQSE